MSLYCSIGSVDTDLSPQQLNELLAEGLAKLGPAQERACRSARPEPRTLPRRRTHRLCVQLLRRPAQGRASRHRHAYSHAPRPDRAHVSRCPRNLFKVHNWRTDIETLGEVPAEFIREQSEGKLDYAWPAQVNKLISQGGFDLILSIGQVVPHEVIGMANLHQEHPDRHRRPRGHQPQPLPGRGLRHGAHHGPR